MRRLFSALAALLLIGCDASGFNEREQAELQAGDVQIALGETARLGGLAISFDAVLTDSRCPLEALCIWAGEASVALTIAGEPVDLLVADPQHAPGAGVRIGDVVLYAVALAPYPQLDEPSDETPVVAVSAVPGPD